jgi:Raf kinase inhibitor-like YbhB/YbcL family protein
MQLTSAAFEDGGTIPTRYTCDGDDLSPPLAVTGIPSDAAALVLIMDDPDAPGGTWDHWIAFDIPVTAEFPEGVGTIGRDGRNSWGRMGYGGPCPPSGTHRYEFRVIAVSSELGLAAGAGKAAILAAARPVSLAEVVLTATYTRE